MSKASQKKLSKKKTQQKSSSQVSDASPMPLNQANLAKAYTQPKPAMPINPGGHKPMMPKKAGRKR